MARDVRRGSGDTEGKAAIGSPGIPAGGSAALATEQQDTEIAGRIDRLEALLTMLSEEEDYRVISPCHRCDEGVLVSTDEKIGCPKCGYSRYL